MRGELMRACITLFSLITVITPSSAADATVKDADTLILNGTEFRLETMKPSGATISPFRRNGRSSPRNSTLGSKKPRASMRSKGFPLRSIPNGQKTHLRHCPPIGGQFDESPERLVRMGVRGGAGRIRTSNQTVMSEPRSPGKPDNPDDSARH